MDALIPIIESGLVVIVPVLVFLILVVNGYTALRKRFSVKVNCWFCNNNSRVPYENANSFICSHCKQYNGFDSDGGYNKCIPEQYKEERNPKVGVVKQNIDRGGNNGLCRSCNINQNLKVKQLATFVPFNEKNFDMEVEEYKKNLEEVYKLCKKCENVLRVTLSVQNSWFIGKTMSYMKKMQKSGETLFNLNVSSHGLTKQRKISLLVTIMQFAQILLALLILYNNMFIKALITGSHINHVNIVEYIPDIVMPHLQNLEIYLKAAWNSTEKYINSYAKAEYLSGEFFTADKTYSKNKSAHLSAVGLLVQLILLLWDYESYSKKKDALSWISLTVLSLLPHSEVFNPYVHVVQSQLALYVIHSVILKRFFHSKPPIRLIKRKMPINSSPIDAEYSDKEEELNEELSNLSKNSSSSSATTKTYKSENWSKVERTKIISDVLRKLQGKCKDLGKHKNKQRPALNRTLDNLHLTGSEKKLKNFTKPLISPPKFNTTTAQVATMNNSWNSFVDLSRSSSATSGFASQAPENDNIPLPNSRKNSFSDESDKSSSSELKRVFDMPQKRQTTKTNNIVPQQSFNMFNNMQNSPRSPCLSTNATNENPGFNFIKPNNFNNNYNPFALNKAGVSSPQSFSSLSNANGHLFSSPPGSPFGFNPENPLSSQLNSVYKSENTFYPNLNQNSMLYIQVSDSDANKNPDTGPTKAPNKCYTGKLFNMKALARLSPKSSDDFDEISSQISDRFKLY